MEQFDQLENNIACVDIEEEISDEEKKELWTALSAEQKFDDRGLPVSMRELQSIDPEQLTDLEWYVLEHRQSMDDREIANIAVEELQKLDQSSEPLGDQEKPKHEKYKEPYKSRHNFYALMTNYAIVRDTPARVEKIRAARLQKSLEDQKHSE